MSTTPLKMGRIFTRLIAERFEYRHYLVFDPCLQHNIETTILRVAKPSPKEQLPAKKLA